MIIIQIVLELIIKIILNNYNVGMSIFKISIFVFILFSFYLLK